jgi:V8-like Glu-specific endopeptidase
MLPRWLLASLAVFAATIMNPDEGSARTYKIGALVPILNVKATSFTKLPATRVVWEAVIQLQTTRMRLHFTDIQARMQGPDFDVVVRDLDNDEVLRIPRAKLTAHSDYWTESISRSFLIVQVESIDGDLPEGLQFSVSEAVVDHTEVAAEDVTEPNDMEWAAIAFNELRNGRKVYYERGQSTAILRFITDDGEQQCSGFMISPNELMTNAHCIHNTKICRTAKATFGYQQSKTLRPLDGEQVSCVSVRVVDRELDFAVVVLEGTPGTPDRWGHLVLSAQRARTGDALYIIHYPGNVRMKATWNDCRLERPEEPGLNPARGSDFGHICDTDGGSSGAPILSQTTNEVTGMHHFGFTECNANWSTQNRGVYMDLILDRLREIERGADAGVTEDGPAPDETTLCGSP